MASSLHEAIEQRRELVEPQRVLRIALRARRLFVDFEEDAVDARGDASRRQRLDELGLTRGHAVAGARELQAVRDVEDDRHAQSAHQRKGAHVDDQIVIPEGRAAFGDEHAVVAAVLHLRDRMTHVERREELSLLDVDRAPGLRRRHEQVGLPAQERGDLQDVHDRRDRLGLPRFMDVGQDGHAGFFLHARERPQPLVEAGAPERRDRCPVRFIEGGLEDVRHAGGLRNRLDGVRQFQRVRFALDDARAADEDERCTRAHLVWAEIDGRHGTIIAARKPPHARGSRAPAPTRPFQPAAAAWPPCFCAGAPRPRIPRTTDAACGACS